jgi:uncharacterized protein (TIGR03084 family)
VTHAPATLEPLLADLAAECGDLDVLVAVVDNAGWDLSTPAEGWAVRDQVSHLAFFDDVAAMAITAPGEFRDIADAAVAGGDPMEEHLLKGRALRGDEVLAWWRAARTRLQSAAATLEPDARVPWFGPPMGARSFVSARIMETWAHGTDVADAMGVTRKPTDRLHHVAHLGVRARPFSYAVRGLEPPLDSVCVQLTGPSGAQWSWEGADTDVVRGSALDFCLVVTQRRHVDDTDLVVTGRHATEWMAIAQAFAGPAGPGRQPLGAPGRRP